MNNLENAFSPLDRLVNERLAVVRTLADSLEVSRLALLRNDAESIARGAAHQAELCRQWSLLEDQLRVEGERRVAAATSADFPEGEQSARLAAEWETLRGRIRYLTRVHSSLLRHMQRSLSILQHVVESCAPTYLPAVSTPELDICLKTGD